MTANEPVMAGLPHSEQDRSGPVLRAGNTNCGGCGMSNGHLFMSRAAGNDYQIQMVIPACCGIVTPGQFPYSNYGVPVVASTFGGAAAVACGLSEVANQNDDGYRVVVWAGDGGTYDIGFATMSASAERNDDIMYVCYDNEIYGNTGGQRSSATPKGASTTTTPKGKDVGKKDIMGILGAHGIPYATTISLAHPEDAIRKFKKALGMKGFRFVHILAPCPTGWKSEPGEGIEIVRLGVKAGLFPIFEIEDGFKYTINVEPEMCDESLGDYLSKQGRFRKSGVTVADLRESIDRYWRRLRLLSRDE